jgi:hypothetical protein
VTPGLKIHRKIHGRIPLDLSRINRLLARFLNAVHALLPRILTSEAQGLLAITLKSLTRNASRPLAFHTPFALIACQRSGTHLLREILNSNPCIALLAEPFSRQPQSVYWLNFVRTLPENQYPPLLPEDATALLDQYLQVIQRDVQENRCWYGGSKVPLKALGLDVKYNQLKCVTPLITDLRAQPFLLDYFWNRRFRIVHMVRNNVVHAALSGIISNIRGVWQNYDDHVIQGQFRIPPAELFRCIRWIQDEREEFLRLAQSLPMQTCVYEELVEDLRQIDASGFFPKDAAALRPLAKFLGVPNRFRYGREICKVINRPYAEILENYDELVRALADSEFAELADTL